MLNIFWGHISDIMYGIVFFLSGKYYKLKMTKKQPKLN